MKKGFVFALSSLLLFSSLTACGGSDKLPSTDYEKVKFAFNGVEKSLRNIQYAKKSYQPALKKRIGGTDTSGALNTLYGLFSNDDADGNKIEDLEYDQPPMIQFQYIKKVLERVGDNYQFGTKYYGNITGDVYVDIATGLEAEGEEYKYTYRFGLGIEINIDKNDLITADVSFDINFSKANESYTTKWYVCLELDYDMTNTSPNYTLAMMNENDEKALPYEGNYIYEYDYVDTKNSAISEWRKFCMGTEDRLIKDESHQSFDAYADKDYTVECFAWYKDGSLYKNNHLNENQKKSFAESLFGGLGLNATELASDTFFDKQGTENNVLETMYNDFSRIYGKDIIYDLVTREEGGDHGDDHGQGQQKQVTRIRPMRMDLSGGAVDYHISSTVTIREIFSGYFDGDGNKTVVVLCYVDENDQVIEEIRNLESLAFSFKLANYDTLVPVQMNDTLYDAYLALLQTEEISDDENDIHCEIVILDANNIEGRFSLIYSGDIPSAYTKPVFPKVLADMGVPEYDGAEIQFEYSEQDNKKLLDIINSNADEARDYIKKLGNNGFREVADMATDQNEYVYAKKADDGDTLYVSFKFLKDNTAFLLTAWLASQQSATVEAVSLVGDFNDWDVNDNCIDFTKVNNTTFMLEDVELTANLKYKFVINHDWGTTGGIGYHAVAGLSDLEVVGEEYLFTTDNGPEGNILVVENCIATFTAQVIQETGVVIIKLETVKKNTPTTRYTITADEWNDIVGGSMVNPKQNYTCTMEHVTAVGSVEYSYFYMVSGDIKIATPASYDAAVITEEYYRLKQYSNPTSAYVHYVNGQWEDGALNTHYNIFYMNNLGLIFDLAFNEITYNETDHCYECSYKKSYPYDYAPDRGNIYENVKFYFVNGQLMKSEYYYNRSSNYSFTYSDYGTTQFDLPRQ